MGNRYTIRLGWLMALVIAAACSGQGPVSVTPVPSVTSLSVPSDTPLPIPSATPAPTSTATVPPTATQAATATPPPTATTVPTRQPNEAFWDDLQKYPVTSASIVGPSNYLYTAYLFSQTPPLMPYEIHQVSPGPLAPYPGVCKLYLFRWDGGSQQLVYSYDGKAACLGINSDEETFTDPERRALGLNGYWSDINHNGLPELALYQSSGCAACNDMNSGRIELFEIQTPDRVVDIAADVPGQITFWPGAMLHAADPLTIYARDYTLWGINTFFSQSWIYEWKGGHFVNVSTEYPDEFQLETKRLAAQAVGAQYVDEEAALKILVIYNQVHLPPKDGLDLFRAALSRPPYSSSKEAVCWQQLARAYAQLDYEHSLPFRLFSSTDLIYGTMVADARSWADRTKGLRAEIDEKRFDVSACK